MIRVRFPFISCLLPLASLAAAGSGHAASAIWGGATDGSWATDTNWSATPVPGTGDTATFNGAGNGNTVLDLGGGVTIGTLSVESAAAAGYTFGSGGTGAQSLILDHAGAINLGALVAADQRIDANLQLGVDGTAASYTIDNDSASILTFAGAITGGPAGTAGLKTLDLTGTGATVISGAVTAGGATALDLNQSGSGVTSLTEDNDFGGGIVTITDGELQAIQLTDDGSAGQATPLSGVGGISLNGGQLTFAAVQNNQRFGDALLTVGGDATIEVDQSPTSNRTTLTARLGNNNGAMSIGAHTLTVQTGTTMGVGDVVLNNSTFDARAIALTGAATFDVQTSTTLTAAGISGNFGFTKSGVGTLNVNGASTYTGTALLQSGNLRANAADALKTVQVDGGSLQLRNVDGLASAVVTMNGGTLAFQNDADLTTYNLGAVSVADGASVTFNANRTSSSGGTGQTLIVQPSQSIVMGVDSQILFSAGNSYVLRLEDSAPTTPAFDLQGNVIFEFLTSLTEFNGTVTDGADDFRVRWEANDGDLGRIGAVQDYSGDTQIRAATNDDFGTVQLGIDNALPFGAGVGNFSVGVTNANVRAITFDLNGFDQTVNGLSGDVASGVGSYSRIDNSSNAEASTFTFGDDNRGGTFRGEFIDSGTAGLNLNKIGDGVITLEGVNDYDGTTTVSGGLLRFGFLTSLYNNSQANWNRLTVQSGATASFSVDPADLTQFQKADLDFIRSNVIFADGANFGIRTLNGVSFTYDSVITDTNGGNNALGFLKDGSGQVTLDQVNTYTGDTIFRAGVLVADNASAFGSTGNLTFTGGRMRYTANSAAVDFSARIAGSTDPIDIDTNDQTVDFNNPIAASNIGGLTVRGLGNSSVLNLNVANSFSGPVVVRGGTLNVNHSDALGDGDVTIQRSEGQVRLALADGVDLDNRLLVSNTGGVKILRANLLGSGIESTWSGEIEIDETTPGNFDLDVGGSDILNLTNRITDGSNAGGGAGIDKIADGRAVLSGANSDFSGPIRVLDGTLQVDANLILATGAVTVDNTSGGVSALAGIGTIGGSTDIINGGTISPGQSGGADRGLLTFISDLTQTNGTIALSAMNVSDFDMLNVGGQLTLNPGQTIELVADSGFGVSSGDIFNLLDWASLVDNGFDIGTPVRDGSSGNADLILPDISSFSLLWDASSFLTNGTVSVVPEPSRVALVLIGFTGLFLRRRR